MKHILLYAVLLLSGSAFCQKTPDIKGTWKAISKIETETTEGAVTDEDKEIYKAGEKTYTFTAESVTISQGSGKHIEKLPIQVQGNQLFIGKSKKNKQPYILSVKGSHLLLTKTKNKVKKGKTQVVTEVVTLEK